LSASLESGPEGDAFKKLKTARGKRMISIANETAASFLRQDLLKHLAEVMQLELNMPPFPMSAFADAMHPTTVMLVWQMPYGVNAFISHHSEVFASESLDYLITLHGKFSLSSVDQRVFRTGSVSELVDAAAIGCIPCLACSSSDAAPILYPHCRQLNSHDRRLFEQYALERGGPGPSQSELFELFVERGKGEIFGIEDKGELSGYLSCFNAIDNVWDVEFVHVREDRRGRDTATQLASAYARARLARGEIAYYSGPSGPASVRVAEKSGFIRCRELYCAEINSTI